jgi:hypothetical protein
MDVFEYFAQKEIEFDAYSAYPDTSPEQVFQAAPDSDQRGRIFGNLSLGENAYLRVLEHVVVRGNSVHRDSYAYHLMIDDVYDYGWERDPSHDPAVHEHEGTERLRKATQPISLKRALELSWDRVTQRAEMSLKDG